MMHLINLVLAQNKYLNKKESNLHSIQNPKIHSYVLDSDEFEFPVVINTEQGTSVSLFPTLYYDKENNFGFQRVIIHSDKILPYPMVLDNMKETKLFVKYQRKSDLVWIKKAIYKSLTRHTFSKRYEEDIINKCLSDLEGDPEPQLSKVDLYISSAITFVNKLVATEKESKSKEISAEIMEMIQKLVEENGDKITLKTMDKMVNFMTGQILKHHRGTSAESIKNAIMEYFIK